MSGPCTNLPRRALLLVTIATLGCGEGLPRDELIFLDGRAVASAGDSVFAITDPGLGAVLLRHRRTGTVDTLGASDVDSPLHVQWSGGKWYVSDVREGDGWIVVFGADGHMERRIPLEGVASAPHQFAVLPEGEIVVEAPDNRLVTLTDGEPTLFALTQRSSRTGLVVAARGGVLHAVPDRDLTLYNARGNIRWRLEWPWDPSAFVADLAVDSRGRPFVLAGQEGREGFVVFGILPETGEVGRWSPEGPYATFVVRPLGDILPDSADRYR